MGTNYYLKTKTDSFHIGKSSAGWHFLLVIYPDLNLNNLEDWKKVFTVKENTIVNEYGDIIPPKEMIKIITERENPLLKESKNEEEYEQKQLDAYNRLLHVLGENSISSYEEYMEKNRAIKGVNGLWAHDPAKDSSIIPAGLKVTYDYTTDPDFS